MAYSDEAEHRAPRTPVQWFEALAGPILWSVHFLVIYFLVETACRTGILSSVVLGMTLLAWSIVVVTVLAVAVVAWTALQAYRQWQTVRQAGEETGERGLAPGRNAFMTLAGWVLGLLFGLMIVLSAIPPLVLRPCTWT